MQTLVTLSVLFLVLSVAKAEIVDGVVATVGEKVITLSEVMAEAKIVKISHSKKRSVSLPIEVSYSAEILDQMINRELVYLEAKKVRAVLEDVDLLDEMLDFEEKFQSQTHFYDFLEREGLKVEDMAERFLKKRVGMKYVAKRLSLTATVSKKEVEDYYRDNRAYEGVEMKDAEAEIKEILMKEKMKRSLDEWLSTLRKRGKVQYVKLPLYFPSP